jgi:TolB-like protein/Flp pilus assembly protein TadD
MSMRAPLVYRFGSFRLDPANRLLSHNRQLIPIAPKPFEALLVLVQRHGQIVHKEELIKLIWADTFVEEANISQNVFLLRKLLGKDGEGRQYIETIPGRGYRFVGKVREEQNPSLEVGVGRLGRDRISPKDKQTADNRNRFVASLAILPLANLSVDPDMEYFGDGITENIINGLSQVPRLRVIARTSAFRYKGREISIQEVARELNVETVVTGRIIMHGDTLNVQIEFTHVVDESQFWGKQYDLKITGILEAQQEISQEVLAQLRLKLELPSEEHKQLIRRPTNDVEAYQLYLKGCYYQNKLTEEGLRKGVEYFQAAIAKAPNFALAYTGLADCYALGGLPLDPDSALAYAELVDCYALVTSAPREAMSKAKAAALMALEIDDKLAEAHASLGFIRYRLDWDWLAAEREYRRAIELSPNCPKVHYWLSMCLRTMGRLDEALAEAKLAHEIDPFMHIVKVELGRIFYFARYYDQAIEYYRDVLELEPNFLPAHFRLGQAYTQKGMYEEAIAEFQRAIPLIGDDPEAIAALAHVYALSGRTDEARAVLTQLRALSLQRYVSSYDLAIIYVGLDDKDKALEWLQNAYADRSVWLIGIKVEPMLDSLRPDPRFAELMRRIGFEP